MKFLLKFTFVREFRDTEDKVELFNNETQQTVILTWKQYMMMKGYYENVRYIVREEDDNFDF